ncbi:MAG: chemotaxis protein CheD [Myxococcota bacterium]
MSHASAAHSSRSGARKINVGISELQVSRDTNALIMTHALGSCVGVAIYDPVAHVGGLLHAQLPDSRVDADKAARQPAMFVNTGLPKLFKDAYAQGAQKERLVVKIAGGASFASGGRDVNRIGARNVAAVRQMLLRNRVLIAAAAVGGNVPRTLALHIGSGELLLIDDNGERKL